MLEKQKSTKGITLIALVITIIVLLILAGVSIATLTGENGILTQAESAREQTKIAEEKEAVLIAYAECQMNSRQGSVTEGKLETALKNNGKNASVELEGEELIITFLDTNNKYSLTEAGGVEYKRPLTEEEAKMIISAGVINTEYVYVETAGGEVKVVENTEQTNIEAIDTKDATIITINGIREIGDNYLIDKKGKVYTWGYNDNGQLGIGETEYSDVPICISDIEDSALNGKNITNILYIGDTVIARDSEGKIYTWGDNYSGRAGNGTEENSNVPVCISDIEGSGLKGRNITDIINTDSYWVIAKDNEGKVYTWGANGGGQLGNGTTENSNVPICISDIEDSELNGKNIINIEIGVGAVIAIDSEGKVYTWGNNSNGQLGNGTTGNNTSPTCISDIEDSALNGKNITTVKLSVYSVIAKDDKGKIYTWGYNYYGQLGNGTTENSNVPICISDIEDNELEGKEIISIESFGTEMIVRDNEGKVYTWGDNSSLLLGNGTTEGSTDPICISDIENSELNGKNIVNVEVSWYSHVTAIDNEGKVYTWGTNNYGQLGNGTTENSTVPICISDIENSELNGKNITNIEIQDEFMIVKDDKGKVYAWGNNSNGQLGNGTTENSNVPICISDIEGVIKDKSIKSINYEYKNGNYMITYISEDGIAYKYLWENSGPI